MKTSTKLLIVFFVSIPLSLVAYNYLAKRQFVAGNFVEANYISGDTQYEQQTLPAFKYVNINGAFAYGEDAKKPQGYYNDWMPQVSIDNSDTVTLNHLNVLKPYKNILHFVVKHDTLYISFFNKTMIADGPYRDIFHDVVQLKARHVKQIDVQNGLYNYYNHAVKNDTVNFSVFDKSTLGLNNLDASMLTVHAANNATLTIGGNNKAASLDYVVLDNSTLNIDPAVIKGRVYGMVSKQAKIAITGNGPQMQKYLANLGVKTLPQ